MKAPSVRSTGITMIVILAVVIVFHLLVLTEVIPYDVAWGGRLKNYNEMIMFELLSITVNILLIGVISAKLKYYPLQKHTVTNVLLWIMFGVFTLNTIGNLFAATGLERYIATPLTFISALMCLRLAMAKSPVRS